MRITNNMITSNFLTGLNKSLQRQNTIQEQLTDGKAIHRPSDDPVKAMRSLRFSANLAQNEQYSQNAQDASSWMDTTDGAMSDLSSIMIRVKELVVQAANGTNSPADINAAGKEVDGLIDQVVQIGNSKIGDRYIFAGQQDKIQPFSRTVTAGPPPSDVITYAGDNNKISMPLQPGAVNPSRDSINLTGDDVFGPGQKLLNDLVEIKNQLTSANPDTNWLSNTGLSNVDADHSQLLQAQTDLGSRMSMYNLAQTLLDKNNTTITGDLSANDDVDVAKAIIEFKTSETAYNAALSVGARIMPPSLVDFLK